MKELLLVIIFALFVFNAKAQDGLEGLWEVTSVSVGDKVRTPVSKWFRFNGDMKYTSGNGWTQNSAGDWALDNQKMELTLNEKVALSEGNEPFKLAEIKKNYMKWAREEFGEMVTVQLKRIEEIPQAPTDKVQGLWKYEEMTKNGKDISSIANPESERMIFILLNKKYKDVGGSDGTKRGYWIMDMHKPIITLIPHDRTKNDELWEVAFTEKKMTWWGKSESNKDELISFIKLQTNPD